jgi:hypothetical protein
MGRLVLAAAARARVSRLLRRLLLPLAFCRRSSSRESGKMNA